MNTIQASLIISTTALLTLPTHAGIIYMTHQGTGSGTIGQLTFNDANFTITASADFDDTISYLNGKRLVHETTTITIEGVGIFDFITQTQTYVNYNFGTVGFTRTTLGDLYKGPYSAQFFDWNMDTEIGPITGDGDLLQWDFEDVITTGGRLDFNASQTNATFTASYTLPAIPAPAALSLLTITGLTATRRRR